MRLSFLASGERDVIALRIVALSPGSRAIHADQRQDAGWLVRKGARLGAIGIATGTLSCDGSEVRPSSHQAMALPTSDYEDRQLSDAGSALDPEACALEQLRDLWLRCTSPLLVTCGGRTSDLPFLRYRCLARNVSIPALHLCTANRFG